MAPKRDESDSGSEYSPGAKVSVKHAKRERDDSSDSEYAPAKRSVKQGSTSKSPSPKKPRNVGAARKAGFNTGPWTAEEDRQALMYALALNPAVKLTKDQQKLVGERIGRDAISTNHWWYGKVVKAVTAARKELEDLDK